MSTNDIESELRALLEGIDSVKKAKLMGVLKELEGETEKSEKKTRFWTRHSKTPSHEPVTRYTKVTKHYTCLHCGTEFNETISLSPTDVVPSVSRDGHVILITASSPAIVDCFTSHCSHCETYVSKMERSELEKRYIESLKNRM